MKNEDAFAKKARKDELEFACSTVTNAGGKEETKNCAVAAEVFACMHADEWTSPHAASAPLPAKQTPANFGPEEKRVNSVFVWSDER